jgi:hypothetical protein
LSILDGGGVDAGAPTAVITAPAGFLKGQLHAHSSNSQDSTTPPADVHRWYEEHGFDFVVFTDHNVVTDTSDTARTLTAPGVELTHNLPQCDPPVARGSSCSLHMNALFVDPSFASPAPIDVGGPGRSIKRRDVYVQELKRTKELGGLAMLCHPNLLYSGPDEALVFELAHQHGLRLMEIANEAWDSQNAGDADHPSTEAIWDGALSRGAHLFATATDDAHHYGVHAARMREQGERPFEGDRGFVLVRNAAQPTTATVRAAIEKGDFYSSTGIVFDKYELSTSARSIALSVRDGVDVVFEVIRKGGSVTRRERASHLEVTLGPDDGPYLRIRARRDDGAMAWTQPVFR